MRRLLSDLFPHLIYFAYKYIFDRKMYKPNSYTRTYFPYPTLIGEFLRPPRPSVLTS
jgi:hypothetical protein